MEGSSATMFVWPPVRGLVLISAQYNVLKDLADYLVANALIPGNQSVLKSVLWFCLA